MVESTAIDDLLAERDELLRENQSLRQENQEMVELLKEYEKGIEKTTDLIRDHTVLVPLINSLILSSIKGLFALHRSIKITTKN